MRAFRSRSLSCRQVWRCGRWLLGGIVIASITAACGRPVDAAAYRQACDAYTASLTAMASVDVFERTPLAAGLPDFRLGLIDARRSHDPRLVRAFESLITEALVIEAAGPENQREPKKIASSIVRSATTVVKGCKAEGKPIPTKSPLRLV